VFPVRQWLEMGEKATTVAVYFGALMFGSSQRMKSCSLLMPPRFGSGSVGVVWWFRRVVLRQVLQ